MWRRILAVAALVAVASCGDSTRTIRLVRVVPEVDPACGAPGDAVTMRITAVGDFTSLDVAEVVDVASGEVSLDRFPPATRALEVVVLGQGGEERVIGRTGTFALDDLESGDDIPVFMAPRRGFCPTGPPAVARERPLLARAGNKVLIAGGVDGDQPVTEVELYDPATGQFQPLGPILSGADGLAGASATTLADGRVLIAGGPNERYVLFDPETETAGSALFFDVGTAYHASTLLPDGRVLFAGGCSTADLVGVTCDSGVTTIAILDVVAQTVVPVDVALLTPRIGGTAVIEADGRLLLAGGVDPDGNAIETAERVDLAGVLPTETIPTIGSAIAVLDAGGLASAFASPLAASENSVATVLAPGAPDPIAIAGTPSMRAGTSMTALEDGRVLALGGTPDFAEAMLYLPAAGRFQNLPTAPTDRRSGHGAVRLDDGSVLVLGGSGDGGALADAWIFRPDLTGPFTASLDITFENELAQGLVPRDPDRIVIEPPAGSEPAHYIMASSGSSGLPSEWAVVAGPRLAAPKVSITAGTDSDMDNAGIAVLIGFTSASDYRFLVLRPGQRTELLHVVTGQPMITGCEGGIVEAAQLQSEPRRHLIEVALSGGELTCSIDGDELLRCVGVELPIGAAGVGIVGPEDDTLVVDRIAVSR